MAYSLKFKLKIVKHVRLNITPIENISIIRNVPKQTIYRWLKKFKKFGQNGLENKKPGAKESRINVTFEKVVLSTWELRRMGVYKMWLHLEKKGFGVSERQIQKIYRKHNLKMSKRRRPEQIKYKTYEWPKPNMLWHTDWTVCPFTGMQLIAFIDDNSRYIIHAEYFNNATTRNTILAFQAAIKKHGSPENIITDHGVQFHENGPFEEFCKSKEIKHILGRVNHPQTNGKIERWFGTYKQEFKDEEDTLNTFVNYYNNERLHQGINYKIPSDRYKSNINAV